MFPWAAHHLCPPPHQERAWAGNEINVKNYQSLETKIEPPAALGGQVPSSEPRGRLDSVRSVCNEEGRDRTQDRLLPHAIRRDLSPMPISLPVVFFFFFYLFNAQAVFITSLLGGSASLQQNKCGLCFFQRGRGLVLDLRSHSALRGSHCLGPLFVRGLQREKGPARGEGGNGARV